MPVGLTPIAFYEKEDVTVTGTLDAGVFSGSEVIQFVVKAEADDPDPPLLIASVTPGVGVNTAVTSFYGDLAPGAYVYGERRTQVGARRQLAQAELIVLESVNV